MSRIIRNNSPILMPWTSQPQVPVGNDSNWNYSFIGGINSYSDSICDSGRFSSSIVILNNQITNISLSNDDTKPLLISGSLVHLNSALSQIILRNSASTYGWNISTNDWDPLNVRIQINGAWFGGSGITAVIPKQRFRATNFAARILWTSRSTYNYYDITIFADGKQVINGNIPGDHAGITNQFYQSGCLCGGYAQRFVTNDQLKSLSLNPWQIFKPQARPYPIDLDRKSAEPRRSYFLGTNTQKVEDSPDVFNVPYTSQPQGPVEIDWSNPLGKKVISTFLPLLTWPGYDFVKYKLGVMGYGSQGILKPSAAGYCFNKQQNQTLKVTTTTFNETANFILGCEFYVNTLENKAIASTFTAGGDESSSIVILSDGSIRASVAYYSNGQITIITSNTNIVSSGRHFALIVVTTGVGTSSIKLYLDGVLVASQAPLLDNFHPGGSYLSVGSYSGGALSNSTGVTVQGIFRFSYPLTEPEVKSISNNPWQIFKPQQRKIFKPSPRIFQPTTSIVTSKQPWRQQPQVPVGIDWSNALVKAIAPIYVHLPSAGLLFDASLQNLKGAIQNTPRLKPTPAGIGLNSPELTASSASGHCLKTGLYPDATYTFLAVLSFFPVAPASAYPGYSHGGSHDGTRRFYVSSTDDTISWTRIAGWGSAVVTWSGPAIVAGTIEFLTLVKPSGNPIFYVNGKAVGSISSPAWSGTSTRQIYLGKRTLNSATEDGTQVKGPENTECLAIVGKGSPDAAAVAELNNNPWQIFRPRTNRIIVDLGSSS